MEKEESVIKAIEEIASQLGEESVLVDDLDRSAYSYDASGMQAVPSAVIRPSTADDVSFVVEVANKFGIPITPRGSGTSLVGGPLPVSGGFVVDMQKMNGIIDKDEENGLVRVEAGINVRELNEIFPDRFMPINPDGAGFSTVGGLIAEDSASPLSIRYGTMGDLLYGVEVVLPNGEIILVESPGPPSRRSILNLLVGSEGTLGIFTSALLRLPRRPENRIAYKIELTDISDALILQEEIEKSGIGVSAFEVYHNYKELVEGAGTEAVAFIEISGTQECIEIWDSRLKSILGNMEFPFESMTEEKADNIWEGRKNLYEVAKVREEALKVVSLRVYPSLVRDTVQEADRTGSRLKLPVISVHNPLLGWVIVAFLYNPIDEKEVERAERAVSNVISKSISLGGSVGYGLGAGINRITQDMDEGFVSLLSIIKETLDPSWIMNPGKLIER